MSKSKKYVILVIILSLAIFIAIANVILNKKNYVNKSVDNDVSEKKTEYVDNSKIDVVDVIEEKETIANNVDEIITNNSSNQKHDNKSENKKQESNTSNQKQEIVTENNDNKEIINSSQNNEEKKEQPIVNNSEQVELKKDDNSVDTDSIDYPIHKGRIDCKDLNDCMNKSLPIQYEFKKSISNSFYLEVIAKNDNSLGYFIEYVFKENNYGSNEECEKIGSKIKQTLSDRVIGYECSSNGNLKIKTDY